MAAVMTSSFDGLSRPSSMGSGSASSPSLEAEYRRVKEQLAQLEQAFAEFQMSSRELETELELELEEKDRVHEDMLNKVDQFRHEVSEWKAKYMESQREHAAAQQSNHKRIATLEEAHRTAMSQLRQMEMANDDMERHERIAQSSLSELEQKYHSALEEVAMLEAEVAGKDDLKTEIQRVKDELRDSQEDVAKLNRTLAQQEKQLELLKVQLHDKNTENDPQSSKLSEPLSLDPKSAPLANGSRVQRYASYAQAANGGLSSSKSLRKIHGMLDQMKSLESRVATFKSSLPRSATPNQRPLLESGRATPTQRTLVESGRSTPSSTSNRTSSGNTSSTGFHRRPGTPNKQHHPFTAQQRILPSPGAPGAGGAGQVFNRRSMTPTPMGRSRTPSLNMHSHYGNQDARRGSESAAMSPHSRAKTPLGETSIPVSSRRSVSNLGGLNQDPSSAERRHRRRELSMSTTLQGSSLPKASMSGSVLSDTSRRSHVPMRSVGSRSQLFSAEPSDPTLRPTSASAFSQYQSRSSLGHGRLV